MQLSGSGGGGVGPQGPPGAQGAPGVKGPAGAHILLAQLTASGSPAGLGLPTVFQDNSTYDLFLVELLALVPGTNASQPWIQFSSDGSTYLGASYGHRQMHWSSTGTFSDGAATGAGAVALTGSGQRVSSTASFGGFCCTVRVYAPASAFHTLVTAEGEYYSTNQALRVGVCVSGELQTTAALTGLQVRFDTGTISSGTVRVYGIT